MLLPWHLHPLLGRETTCVNNKGINSESSKDKKCEYLIACILGHTCSSSVSIWQAWSNRTWVERCMCSATWGSLHLEKKKPHFVYLSHQRAGWQACSAAGNLMESRAQELWPKQTADYGEDEREKELSVRLSTLKMRKLASSETSKSWGFVAALGFEIYHRNCL